MSGWSDVDATEWDVMARLGYGREAVGERRPTTPDGRVIPDGRRDRMTHVCGRLRNVDYMSDALDDFDGVAHEGRRTTDGRAQFRHLHEKMPVTAAFYVMLRRIERSGDVDALRRAVVVMVAWEHDELSAADAVGMVWRPEWAVRRSIPAPVPALPGSTSRT